MSIFRDGRKQRRISLERPLIWETDEHGMGHAVLVDVSLGGACFRIVGNFAPRRTIILRLRVPSLPEFPRTGRLRWFRKVEGREPAWFCGVTFSPEAISGTSWATWIEEQEKLTAEPQAPPQSASKATHLTAVPPHKTFHFPGK